MVGGGLAGLCSAGMLERRGYQVELIEPAAEVGGLLGGALDSQGNSFDYGTHVLEDSGIPEIDEILNGGLDQSDGWNVFASCPSTTYFGGESSDVGFVDTRSLPTDEYDKGLEELLELPEPKDGFSCLEDQLKDTFGETFVEKVFAPILFKFSGKPLSELALNSHHLFGLKRLVCGSNEEAVRWKSENWWNDSRLAFHDPSIGARPVRFLYPKSGGMKTWVDSVVSTLTESERVSLHVNESIETISMEEGKVNSITSAGGCEWKPDHIVWTAPPVFLFKLLGVSMPDGVTPPELCRTTLIDLVVDRPPAFDTFYVNCYDSSLSCFRITNYWALERSSAGESRVTVEFIEPPGNPSTVSIDADLAMRELREIGFYPQSADYVHSQKRVVERGFPVLTEDFVSSSEVLGDRACSLAKNISVVGRASGRSFFMKDVISDVYEELKDLS